MTEDCIFRKGIVEISPERYLRIYEEMKKPEKDRGIITLQTNEHSFDIIPTFILYKNGFLTIEGKDYKSD